MVFLCSFEVSCQISVKNVNLTDVISIKLWETSVCTFQFMQRYPNTATIWWHTAGRVGRISRWVTSANRQLASLQYQPILLILLLASNDPIRTAWIGGAETWGLFRISCQSLHGHNTMGKKHQRNKTIKQENYSKRIVQVGFCGKTINVLPAVDSFLNYLGKIKN